MLLPIKCTQAVPYASFSAYQVRITHSNSEQTTLSLTITFIFSYAIKGTGCKAVMCSLQDWDHSISSFALRTLITDNFFPPAACLEFWSLTFWHACFMYLHILLWVIIPMNYVLWCLKIYYYFIFVCVMTTAIFADVVNIIIIINNIMLHWLAESECAWLLLARRQSLYIR